MAGDFLLRPTPVERAGDVCCHSPGLILFLLPVVGFFSACRHGSAETQRVLPV